VLRELSVIGGGRRTDGMCPVCFCVDRDRLILLFLRTRTRLLDGRPARLLHLAPERSLQHALRRASSLQYFTGDLLMQEVGVRLDVRQLPFAAGTFDALIANHVLEHVTEDVMAMRELHRVLQPGGWAILQVPIARELAETFESPEITSPEGREAAFGQADHVRIYGRDYPARLGEAGFCVQLVPFARELGTLAYYHGLCIDEDVCFCTRE
jgi:SAM-dependent methyltransferase